MNLETVSNDLLERRLKELLSNERRTQAEFLIHLAEFDRRKGYEALGYTSLWKYCFRVLGCSERQASCRSHAAELIGRFPIAARFVADGRICMTVLVELRSILTEENCERVLREAVGKTKDQVQWLVASLNPIAVPEQTMIRREPARVPPGMAPSATPLVPEAAAGGPSTSGPSADSLIANAEAAPQIFATAPISLAAKKAAMEVLPVSAEQYRIRLLVEAEFARKLEKAKSYLSHRIPDGDVRKVLAYGLDLILKEAAKHQDPNAVRARKGARVSDEDSAYIPDALRRLVWERDGGCCVWQTSTGPCGSTYQLQVDHILAVALGGKTVLENLRLLCAAHNLLHARQDFGRELVDSKIAASRTN